MPIDLFLLVVILILCGSTGYFGYQRYGYGGLCFPGLVVSIVVLYYVMRVGDL